MRLRLNWRGSSVSAWMKKISAARPRIETLERRQLLTAAVPHFDHIVLVMEENHAYTSIIGSASAPYINSLAGSGALFTNSSGVSHPSQPNYLALFSGSTQGTTNDTPPSAPYTTPNLGAELLAANDTFVGYSESLPSVGFLGGSATTVAGQGQYYRKHNPWSDWQSATPGGNLLPASVNQPFTSFPTDFTQLPNVSIVVPNQQNDMHDGTIAMGDAWLQSNMQAYANWATTHNSLLVVTWDEDDSAHGNHVATIFYGAGVKTGNYAEPISHYNVLRTIEDSYGLPDAGASATATPITDVWSSMTATTPTTTGVTSSNSSPIYGQAVTFTATVTPTGGGNPTGTVQFQIDGSNAGSPVALVGNTAAYTTSTLTAATHSVSAVYSGDLNFIGSTASIVSAIAPRSLSGSVSVINKVYDGTAVGTVGVGSLTGVVAGDKVTLAGGVAKFSDNNVGTNKVVTVTGLTLNGTAASDYVLANPTETTTAAITAATPTVTVSDAGGPVTGASYPANANVAGVVPGVDSTPAASLEGVAPVVAYYAGAMITGTPLSVAPNLAGIYTVVANFGGSADYASAASIPVTFSIGARPVATVGVNSGDAVYNRVAYVPSATVSGSNGVDTSATVTYTYYPGATTTGTPLPGAPSTVGTYTVVANFLGDSTYAGASSPATTFRITPKTLTGSISVTNKVYDGTTAGTLTSRLVTGVVAGDPVALAGGVARFADSNVGINKTVTVTGLTLSGAAASNYVLSNPTETATGNITARSLVVTANNFTRVYGQPNPAFTATISGLIAADGITASETTSAGQYSPSGTYAILPALKDPNHRLSNYAVTIVKGTLTVQHANTTTTVSSVVAKHGTATVTLTAAVSANGPSRCNIGTGHVTFIIEDTHGNHLRTVNSGTTTNGTATAKLSLSGLAIGSYSIVAVFVPDPTKANFNASTSAIPGKLTST